MFPFFSFRKNGFLFLTLIFFVTTPIIYSHPKGDKLRKLTLESEKGVIDLTKELFEEYVMKHPRPYDFVILFTKKDCKNCLSVIDSFEQVADSSLTVDGFKPIMLNKKRAIFFGIMYKTPVTKYIFDEYDMASMNIVYTIPKDIRSDKSGNNIILKNEESWIPLDGSDYIYPLKLLELINGKSGRTIMLKKNPMQFIYTFTILIMILFTGIFIYTKFTSFILNPWLWYAGSIFIFIVGLGGMVFSITQNSNYGDYDDKGNAVSYIHNVQSQQYFFEGIGIATLYVIIGSLFALMTCLNWVRGYWTHKFLCILIIFTIFLGSRQILEFYRRKASWYGPKFYPPSDYKRGSLLQNQGNSF